MTSKALDVRAIKSEGGRVKLITLESQLQHTNFVTLSKSQPANMQFSHL